MPAMSGFDDGIEKIAQDWALGAFAVAHPAASARGVIHFGGGRVAVVGRIAEADDDGHAALDRERAGVLLRDRLQEERGLKWFSVWAFERIG